MPVFNTKPCQECGFMQLLRAWSQYGFCLRCGWRTTKARGVK
jgi:hypothetical protein